jgi:hypothetical protein
VNFEREKDRIQPTTLSTPLYRSYSLERVLHISVSFGHLIPKIRTIMEHMDVIG